MRIEIWLGNPFENAGFGAIDYFFNTGLRTAERAVSSVAVQERSHPPWAREVRMKFPFGCNEISATTC
jgi:hypothetical protein